MKLVIEKEKNNAGKDVWIDFDEEHKTAYLHTTEDSYNKIKNYYDIDKDYEEIIKKEAEPVNV